MNANAPVLLPARAYTIEIAGEVVSSVRHGRPVGPLRGATHAKAFGAAKLLCGLSTHAGYDFGDAPLAGVDCPACAAALRGF